MHLPLGTNRFVEVVSTDRSHGDFAVTSGGVQERRQSLMSGKWTWLRLVHGATIVSVGEPGEGSGSEADGAITGQPDVALAVTTADCAPVVLAGAVGDRSCLAVVHAGWRGLQAGIVESAAALVLSEIGIEAGAAIGAEVDLVSYCGPCIGPADYEFATEELEPLVANFGPAVGSQTSHGAPALDLFAGVAAALDRSRFPVPERPRSTADPVFFSHRVRVDPERMTTVARMLENAHG